MANGHVLTQYLAAIGKDGEEDNSTAQLARGQFHDVVLLGEVAYRVPRHEASPPSPPSASRAAERAGVQPASVAIPRLLSKAALSRPLGQCHVALRRLPSQPIEHITGPAAEHAVVSSLAGVLNRLGRKPN